MTKHNSKTRLSIIEQLSKHSKADLISYILAQEEALESAAITLNAASATIKLLNKTIDLSKDTPDTLDNNGDYTLNA